MEGINSKGTGMINIYGERTEMRKSQGIESKSGEIPRKRK
jgi:hypothetical protein